ncbi:TlpA family protein disulfide reductase [Ottowia testudinis]|uniref:TlpA family protein disulfide reductase n=1 Tax=Ottowia testudinis TaxID=2816950 RepID=A0A975H508_9BURK|nr:TlpA family protein disulfide reductase [Ottowia testudinis]
MDLGGRAWDVTELKGKVVVLNFWATWCPPCVEEMPALQALHDTVDDDVQVISVSVKDSAPAVRRFVKSHQVTFPVLLDARGELASRWGVKSVPTTVLIDKQGRPRRRITGTVDWVEREPAGWLEALRR